MFVQDNNSLTTWLTVQVSTGTNSCPLFMYGMFAGWSGIVQVNHTLLLQGSRRGAACLRHHEVSPRDHKMFAAPSLEVLM